MIILDFLKMNGIHDNTKYAMIFGYRFDKTLPDAPFKSLNGEDSQPLDKKLSEVIEKKSGSVFSTMQ
jgi:hypothetical protein